MPAMPAQFRPHDRSNSTDRSNRAGGAPDAQFRAVLGHFCSGVTILASTVDAEPVGMTCQSFFSVSLDPRLVAFSVAKTSTTFPVIRRAGTCCVNVLASDQAALSAQFSRSGTDKWAGVEWELSPGTGDPVIKSVLAWIECVIENEHDAGDHVIVIASVRSLGSRAGAAPLLYFRSAYAELAATT